MYSRLVIAGLMKTFEKKIKTKTKALVFCVQFTALNLCLLASRHVTVAVALLSCVRVFDVM